MITLRFDCGLYAPQAVTEASEAFATVAQINRRCESNVELVELTALDEFDEATVAGEFANYILGATVDKSRNPQSSP
jgi:hypothetical protein